MTVEIQVFGGVRALVDSAALEITGDIPRAVLGRLALSSGEFVPTDELLAAVWPDPVESTVSSLRAVISRMRSLGLGDALQGTRQGYLLDVPTDSVDLAAFRSARAAEAGRTECLEELTRLERLSRGIPFGDLETAPYLAAARAGIAEERRAVLEELAEAHLDRGENVEASLLMAEAIESHPLHERPARLLATALARSGRTSDALGVVDAFRERLEQQTGAALPPRILELRQGILRQDPAVLGSAGVRQVRRSGVPIPLTTFVGRDRLLHRIAELRQDARLVTLVGPGGVGKTRLAIEVARAATGDDEQVMVDLASLDDADRVVATVATAVGATEPTVEGIVRRLSGVRALLVLDNADHLLGAVAILVSALLEQCPRLAVLVTSREALRLPDEEVLVVDPLLGPDLDDAVELFAQRASDALGGRGLFESERDQARSIAERLDGIPLALELAASRLDLYGFDELDRALAVPVGDGRHSSVDSAVSWSIGLLDDAQRTLLFELSRFAGPFTVEAAAGICSAADEESVRSLVEKSLVAVSRGSTGRRAYRLLESVKVAARARDDGDPAAWMTRHRVWLAEFVARLEPTLRTFDARATRATFDLLGPDLAVAASTAEAAGDRESALRLAGGQALYWFARGRLLEGRRELERAFAVDGVAEASTESVAHLGLCLLAYQTGDAPAAFGEIALAYEKGVEAGDAAIPAVALAQNAYGRSLFGDVETAEQLIAQSAELVQSAPDWAHAEYWMSRGQMLRALGRVDESLEALTEAHRISSSIGYAWMTASALYVTGKTLVDARRPRDAIALLRSGFSRVLADEDPTSALALAHAAAGACAFVERHEEGAQLIGAVDAIGERYNYSPLVAEGEDAQRLRDAIAIGLLPADFERAVATGRRFDMADIVALLDRLPRSS
ncbi:BTAD domain-containing putative transcriptional regulator [Schumannella luteola]